MNQTERIREIYTDILNHTRIQSERTYTLINRISVLRLLLFIAGITGLIYFRAYDWPVLTTVIAVTFVPFLLLVKKHNRLFHQKDYQDTKIKINEQELQALDYDYSEFEDGSEFVDPSHLYSYDLDIFGNRSFFQYINRTSTLPGKSRLAQWLSEPLTNKEEIIHRQEAVRELTDNIGLRQHYRITGLLYKGKQASENEIYEWANSPSVYTSKLFFRVLPILVPATNAVLLLLAFTGVISFAVWGVVFCCLIVISMAFSGRITKIQSLYGKKLQILGVYARLIRIIEDNNFTSCKLKAIHSGIRQGNLSASASVKKLSTLMSELDQRNNIIIAMLLNGSMFWELRKIMQIESWKEKYAPQLPLWMDAIGEIDAYSSLATFAYNHPRVTYPEIVTEPFFMQATEMCHPLMDRGKCVANDIDIHKRPYFLIVTGANMAGKSTFLRTTGINYLLACIGSPVMATHMKVYPATLITSLRTTDSLSDNESYFFAELKRLKQIIDKLKNGEELFIILDEILKGTNSKDKQKGSFALMKQLIRLNANGIIATHDLLLGTLIETFPDNIRNYSFEATIENDQLHFSYKLHEGVAQNMNAYFLMKKMGIAVE